MTRLIGAELFKLRTTRTFYGLTGISLGLILLIVILVSALADFGPGDDPLPDLMGVAFFMQAITLVLGILIVTSEFRHGTITPSLLVTPDRIKLTLAKLGASLGMGLVLGLITSLLVAGFGALIIGGIRGDETGGGIVGLVIGSGLAAALYAGLGVGIGALVRNQVGAIIGVLVWLFVLEGLVGLIPGIDEVVPKYGLNGVRAGLSGSDPNGGMDVLGQLPAGLILAGYVVVFMIAGLILMRRRDVTA
jgi:ABC-2 type transport system permease protein